MKDNFDIINKTNFNIESFVKDCYKIINSTKTQLKIKKNWELTLNVISPKEIVSLNKKYRQKDYVADVLSFSFLNNDKEKLYKILKVQILGDIFICYDKAKQQADEYGHSLKRELAFLFTHGLLHLLGYDHQTTEEETIMFKLQDDILNQVNILRN